MADLSNFISALQAGDADGLNATRLQQAFDQAALDGSLRGAPYSIQYAPTSAPVLKAHVNFFGAVPGNNVSVLVNNSPTVPFWQLGDGYLGEDGSWRDMLLIRPAWPTYSRAVGQPGFTPAVDAFGAVARYRVENVQMKNVGLAIQLRPNSHAGVEYVPFGWRMRDLYFSCPNSPIYSVKSFGMKIRDSLHNGAQGTGQNGYGDEAALVECAGLPGQTEAFDGWEIDDCIANMNGKGLFNMSGYGSGAGLLIRNSWYDRVKNGGAWIAPRSGIFHQFGITNMRAWGGPGNVGIPGPGHAVVLETRAQDDVRNGTISGLEGTSVHGSLVFMVDRSAAGNAGRFLNLTVRGARSTDRSGLAAHSMIEFGGARGLNCKLLDAECLVGAGGHTSVYANQGNHQNLYVGADVRAL